jgi:transmembrane sensor
MNPQTPMEEEAIEWVIRTRDPGFEDWEGFTSWLERDVDHSMLYDQLSLAEERIADHLARQARSAPLIVERQPRRVRPLWLGGAVAASAAALALFFGTVDRGYQAQEYATGPGERRQIQLADGSRIDLNGSTRLLVDGPRHARLDQGEALFTIVHDETRPFEVASGDSLIRDVGTVFNLVRSPRTFTVTVSEGAIVFNPDEEKVQVPAGKSLEAGAGANSLRLTDIQPDQVGGWREGRLVYQGAALDGVAEDLSRAIGLPVEAAPALARRPFSGIIQIDGKGEPALRAAAGILGVQVRRSGTRWLLTDR